MNPTKLLMRQKKKTMMTYVFYPCMLFNFSSDTLNFSITILATKSVNIQFDVIPEDVVVFVDTRRVGFDVTTATMLEGDVTDRPGCDVTTL